MEAISRGIKQTIWVNFISVAEEFSRPKEHVMVYCLKELNTTGYLDKDNRLVINGRFNSNHFNNIRKNYIEEYVTCSLCKENNSILKKNPYMYTVECLTCGLLRSARYIPLSSHKIIK